MHQVLSANSHVSLPLQIAPNLQLCLFLSRRGALKGRYGGRMKYSNTLFQPPFCPGPSLKDEYSGALMAENNMRC